MTGNLLIGNLLIEWLSWLPNKSDLINFNIVETLRASPKSPPSLKFSEKSTFWGAGRVKKIKYSFLAYITTGQGTTAFFTILAKIP